MSIQHWHDLDDIRGDLAAWTMALLLGWLGGWIHAHNDIATGCERLARFYVGSTTFECEVMPEETN